MRTLGVKAEIIPSTERESELGIIRIRVSMHHRDLLRSFVKQRESPLGPYRIIWEDWGNESRETARKYYHMCIDELVSFQNGGIVSKTEHKAMDDYIRVEYGPDPIGTDPASRKHLIDYTVQELWAITQGVIREAAGIGCVIDE